jgi:hypothetical protein
MSGLHIRYFNYSYIIVNKYSMATVLRMYKFRCNITLVRHCCRFGGNIHYKKQRQVTHEQRNLCLKSGTVQRLNDIPPHRTQQFLLGPILLKVAFILALSFRTHIKYFALNIMEFIICETVYATRIIESGCIY